MDKQVELQEALSLAYEREQEIARKEIRIEYLEERISELETTIKKLQYDEIESICDFCSKNFVQQRKGRLARFCSNSCRQQHYRQNKIFAEVIARNLRNNSSTS